MLCCRQYIVIKNAISACGHWVWNCTWLNNIGKTIFQIVYVFNFHTLSHKECLSMMLSKMTQLFKGLSQALAFHIDEVHKMRHVANKVLKWPLWNTGMLILHICNFFCVRDSNTSTQNPKVLKSLHDFRDRLY